MNSPLGRNSLGIITLPVDHFGTQPSAQTNFPTKITTTMPPFICLRQELSGTSSAPGPPRPSSPSQTLAPLVVGVLFGVAVAVILLWYSCCRGRKGLSKDTRQGTLDSKPRLRAEVRIVRSSGRRSRFVVERLSRDTSSDGHPNVTGNASEPEPIQDTAASNMDIDSEVQQPPRSYMYHPTPYSDPEMNTRMGQDTSGGSSYTPHYPQWEQPTGTALGRRAVTSLPLPGLGAAAEERNAERQDGYRPPRYNSASSPSSNMVESGG
jgi:hypothetical protein